MPYNSPTKPHEAPVPKTSQLKFSAISPDVGAHPPTMFSPLSSPPSSGARPTRLNFEDECDQPPPRFTLDPEAESDQLAVGGAAASSAGTVNNPIRMSEIGLLDEPESPRPTFTLQAITDEVGLGSYTHFLKHRYPETHAVGLFGEQGCPLLRTLAEICHSLSCDPHFKPICQLIDELITYRGSIILTDIRQLRALVIGSSDPTQYLKLFIDQINAVTPSESVAILSKKHAGYQREIVRAVEQLQTLTPTQASDVKLAFYEGVKEHGFEQTQLEANIRARQQENIHATATITADRLGAHYQPLAFFRHIGRVCCYDDKECELLNILKNSLSSTYASEYTRNLPTKIRPQYKAKTRDELLAIRAYLIETKRAIVLTTASDLIGTLKGKLIIHTEIVTTLALQMQAYLMDLRTLAFQDTSRPPGSPSHHQLKAEALTPFTPNSRAYVSANATQARATSLQECSELYRQLLIPFIVWQERLVAQMTFGDFSHEGILIPHGVFIAAEMSELVCKTPFSFESPESIRPLINDVVKDLQIMHKPEFHNPALFAEKSNELIPPKCDQSSETASLLLILIGKRNNAAPIENLQVLMYLLVSQCKYVASLLTK